LRGLGALTNKLEVESSTGNEQWSYAFPKVAFFYKHGRWPTLPEAIEFDKTLDDTAFLQGDNIAPQGTSVYWLKQYECPLFFVYCALAVGRHNRTHQTASSLKSRRCFVISVSSASLYGKTTKACNGLHQLPNTWLRRPPSQREVRAHDWHGEMHGNEPERHRWQ
jgi:hypothetical protein